MDSTAGATARDATFAEVGKRAHGKAALPPATAPASELVERWLPAVLTEAIPSSVDGLEISLGILLEGEGGGEWRLELCDGRISVQSGSREAATVTLIQSEEDFVGMIRGVRGGAVGRRAAEWLSRSAGAKPGLQPETLAGAAERLDRLATVEVRISVRLTGGAEGDWSADLMLGPGTIPDRPHAEVSLTEEDADALVGGELDALQAMMTGRIAVDGELGLLIRIAQT